MRYSKEFKIEAIKRSQNEPVIKVAKDLHISEKSIYRWRKELPLEEIKVIEIENKKRKPIKKKSKTEQINELREKHESDQKLIKELQEENEFLKKATAFFARNLKINS